MYVYDDVGVGGLFHPCVEHTVHEVVAGTDQLEGPVGHTFLDPGVGQEVVEGHVHSLLQKYSAMQDPLMSKPVRYL